MTALYSLALFAAALALVAWVVAAVAAANPESRLPDPDVRFGLRGRSVVAGVLGFGLGGLSATFAGWSTPMALVAGLAGAAFLAASGLILGPEGEGGASG